VTCNSVKWSNKSEKRKCNLLDDLDKKDIEGGDMSMFKMQRNTERKSDDIIIKH